MKVRIVIGVVLLLLACAPAYADEYSDCNQVSDSVLRAKSCRAVLDEPLQNAKNVAVAYVQLCRALADLNSLEAKKVCESANLLYSDPANLVNLGSVEFEHGETAPALQHFEAALALDPEFPEALFNREVALRKLSSTSAVADATPKK